MAIQFNTSGNPFKAKRQKFGLGMMLFLLLIGGAFTGAGFFALSSAKIDSSWPRVVGKITDSSNNTRNGSTTYNPVVEYTVNGQAYTVAGTVGTSSYPQVGAQREVAYNPQQPNQAKVVEGGGTLWFIYLFPAVGIFLLLLAPYLFVRSLKRSKHIEQLQQGGQKLQGVLVDIQSDSGTNNRGYTITVAATDPSGAVQNYQSDPISGIGGLALADFHNNPIPIDVYVDPANPRNYYVDVSDIPNLTPDRIKELLTRAGTSQPAQPAPSNAPETGVKAPQDPTAIDRSRW